VKDKHLLFLALLVTTSGVCLGSSVTKAVIESRKENTIMMLNSVVYKVQIQHALHNEHPKSFGSFETYVAVIPRIQDTITYNDVDYTVLAVWINLDPKNGESVATIRVK
jgi:hypothetical protein